MKKPSEPDGASDRARYEYELRKLDLRVGDLKRYGIQTVLIQKYGEVTEILRELNQRAYLKEIFVSGSARDYGPLGEVRIRSLARSLGKEISRRRYNLVSGLGLGLGAMVTIGALEEKYSVNEPRGEIRYFPFPQQASQGVPLAQVHSRFRRDMLGKVGFSIFICGNRLDEPSRAVHIGKGVLEEFDITINLGRYPIPIGATGHAAKQIWDKVMEKPNTFYPIDVGSDLKILGDIGRGNDEYVEAVFNIVEKLGG